MKRISIDNGHTYYTANEAEQAIAGRVLALWDVLTQAMDDDAREAAHDETAVDKPQSDDHLRFLHAYLARAPHDLVIG